MAEREEVTMGTGVVFRLKDPAAWAITDVVRQMLAEEPKPPMVHLVDQDRDVPNDADPDYVAAVTMYRLRLIERQYEVMIVTGTELVSVPDGFPRPEGDWQTPLRAVGVRLSDKPERQYIEWVKYIAAPSNADWSSLATPLYRKVGTPEEDVAAAVETFRGVPERGADLEPAAAGERIDGD